MIGLAVAENVKSWQNTISPFPIPAAFNAM